MERDRKHSPKIIENNNNTGKKWLKRASLAAGIVTGLGGLTGSVFEGISLSNQREHIEDIKNSMNQEGYSLPSKKELEKAKAIINFSKACSELTDDGVTYANSTIMEAEIYDAEMNKRIPANENMNLLHYFTFGASMLSGLLLAFSLDVSKTSSRKNESNVENPKV